MLSKFVMPPALAPYMQQEPQEPTPLTVSEIAERIRGKGADTASIIERIRHWTREGLLLPIGDRNPGTGRHRRYEWAAVIDAAVLNALADHGIQTAGRNLLFALTIARTAHQDWEAEGRNGPPHFLELTSIRGKAGYVAFPHKGTVEPRPSAEVSTLVNLNQVFARLRGKELAT